MVQPSLESLTLNPGSGGGGLAHDLVNARVMQVILPAYSTGDGAANVVMEDFPFPVRLSDGSSFINPFIADDGAFTPGTSLVLPVGATFDDALPDAINEGDIGAPRMSSRRELYVQIRDAAGNERGLNVDANNAILVQQAAPLDVSGATVIVTDDGNFTLAPNDGVDIGDVDVASMPTNTTSTGTITGVGQAVSVNVPPGGSSVGLQLTGTWAGQIEFEGTVDGTNYVSIFASNNTGDSVNSSQGNGIFILPGAGFVTLRGRASSFSSGTATLDFNASIGGSGSQLTQPLPSGDNNIGNVDIASSVALDVSAGTVTVDNAGTFVVQIDGAALTALQLIDDTVGTDGTVKPTKGIMIGGDNGTNFEMLHCEAPVDNQQVAYVGDHFLSVVSHGVVWDGSGYWSTPGDNNNGMTVNLGSNNDVVASNAGTFPVQEDGAALTALQLIDDAIFTDDNTFTPGTSKINVGGFFADETATDSVDEGDVGAARMTPDRKQIVTDQPHTTGGLETFRSIDLDETEEEVKATAGQVYSINCINLGSSVRFLKFYNDTAANVIVGTTVPKLTIPIPTQGDANGAGFVWNIDKGLKFDTAITVAATTGIADNDAGAPAANEVVLNLGYK